MLTFTDPRLWYPRGYGDQPLYTLTVKGNDKVMRKIGFRRTRLIFNDGCDIYEQG